MRCEEHESKIIAYALGELPVEEAATCRAHIDGCPRCREAYEEYLCLAEGISEQPEAIPTAQESESLSQALDGVGGRRSVRQGFGFGWAWKTGLAACAVAAVAIGIWSLSPQQRVKHGRVTQRDHKMAAAVRHEKKPVAIAHLPKPKTVTVVHKPQPRVKSPLRTMCRRVLPTRLQHRAYVAFKPKPNPPAPQLKHSDSIPPEVAYGAGRLLGLGFNILTENANPETCAKINTTVKGLILPKHPKSKGESNEKNNSSGSGNRVDGSGAAFGAVCS